MFGPYLFPLLQRKMKTIWHIKLKNQRYTIPYSVSGFYRTGKVERGTGKDKASGASQRPQIHSVDPPIAQRPVWTDTTSRPSVLRLPVCDSEQG